MSDKLVIIGNPESFHIGSHLLKAADTLSLEAAICDSREAYEGPRWLSALNWRLRGKRPSRLRKFGIRVVEKCREFRPKWLVATGIAPIGPDALSKINKMGTKCFNYLTDDPWNAAHLAPWFIKTIPLYDAIFSPRRSNLKDLEDAGCRKVSYLPFGYAPDISFCEVTGQPLTGLYECDVIFMGGADKDRLCYISALARAGFNLRLYGNYWDRYAAFKRYYRGHAEGEEARSAIRGARVSLCLIRKANRDGHSMRTFEIPAVGGCILAEDTPEHRKIFGPEGEAAMYFNTVGEMVQKTKFLVANEAVRARLAKSSHALIVNGKNTYKDRLSAMLGIQGG